MLSISNADLQENGKLMLTRTNDRQVFPYMEEDRAGAYYIWRRTEQVHIMFNKNDIVEP